MIERPKTIFCDIDGVLLRHKEDICSQHDPSDTDVLVGVKDRFREWDRKGYRLILTTGRRESTRKSTEEQLNQSGIFYDQLVMGVSGGVRVLINDRKPDKPDDTAIAINLTRNEGLKDVDI